MESVAPLLEGKRGRSTQMKAISCHASSNSSPWRGRQGPLGVLCPCTRQKSSAPLTLSGVADKVYRACFAIGPAQLRLAALWALDEHPCELWCWEAHTSPYRQSLFMMLLWYIVYALYRKRGGHSAATSWISPEEDVGVPLAGPAHPVLHRRWKLLPYINIKDLHKNPAHTNSQVLSPSSIG